MKEDFLENGFVYHIYNRANNFENLFYEEKNYDYFLSLMRKYLVPVCDIYGYCLLKNHFHLLLRIKEEEEIAENLRKKKAYQHFSNMFNSYTKSINKRYQRRGSLFQEHFGRKRITEEEFLRKSIIYIHKNPLKHSVQNDFENYPYSSYRSIISRNDTQLKRNVVLDWFDGVENFIACHKL